MYRFDANGQLMMLELEAAEGTGAPPKRRPGRPDSELVSIPYFHLDLVSGSVDLFGQRHWELRSPWRKGKRPLNTGAAPRIPIRVPLSGILEANPAQKYYLSKVACIGILRRAFERGKELPQKLERALRIQAGLMRPDGQPTGLEAYHINQRDEGIDLHGVSGALLATTNMQRLFGMSQIKQYQINLVLSGIYNTFKNKKENRSFLISPESFTYIFTGKNAHDNEDKQINKLKTCLLMLEKDLYDKYNFKVLVSRPQGIFTKAYVVIRKECEKHVLDSQYADADLRDAAGRCCGGF